MADFHLGKAKIKGVVSLEFDHFTAFPAGDLQQGRSGRVSGKLCSRLRRDPFPSSTSTSPPWRQSRLGMSPSTQKSPRKHKKTQFQHVTEQREEAPKAAAHFGAFLEWGLPINLTPNWRISTSLPCN